MNRVVVAIGAVTLLVGCADRDGDAGGSGSPPSSTAPRSATTGGAGPSTPGTTPATTSSSAPPSTAGAVDPEELPTATVDDDADQDIGVSFELPAGWERSGAAVATEFGAGADCVAGTRVDFEPPTDPAAEGGGEGEAGFALRSTVQVCARPVDGRSLAEFVDDTYGDPSAFEPAELGGLDGYRSTSGRDTIFFVQSASHRFQVLTSVATDLKLEGERLAEVAGIIDTMTFE